MAMSTTAAPDAFLPADTGQLIVQPVTEASIAMQVLGTIPVGPHVDSYRVPIVTDDPTAGWTAEGADITESDQALAEDADYFHKLAALTIISSELANDSAPDAAQQVGLGMARDIARRFDQAFFGERAADNLIPPRGLGNITGITAHETAATTWTDLDPFVAAIYSAELVGATLAGFVAHPDDALALAQLKSATGSNLPLLGSDPTAPTTRLIAGVPLYISPAVTAGTVWGLPRDYVTIPLRQDAEVTRDTSAYFASDRVAIRAIMRATTMFPHPAAIQKITLKAA